MTCKTIAFLPLLFFMLFLLSCAQSTAVRSSTDDYRTTPASTDSSYSREHAEPVISETAEKEEQPVHNALPEAAGLDTKPLFTGDYVVGPEDLLEISVYQVDELNRTVRVSASGYIKLPLSGMIMASGRTVSELEAEIARRLEPYLQEPLVSVFIREYRGQSITVLGAVGNPQVYIVTRQKYLIDMISMAGGLTRDASDICFVRRGGETIIININNLLVQGDMNLNIPVFSGDIIHVPVGGIIFVDGSVRNPGSFSMQGTVTLTQAIAMAGGFRYEAIRDEVRIYRDSGKASREIIDVDYDAILEKKSDDLLLSNKDVIIVPKSGAKAFWSGFVRTIGGTIRVGEASIGAGF